jgi:hypothetical protein
VPVPGSMVLLNHLEEIMAHEHGPIQVIHRQEKSDWN